MAHECIHCGSECYCHGDMSDSVDSLTPIDCHGCGCEELYNTSDMFDDESEDDDLGPMDEHLKDIEDQQTGEARDILKQ